MTDVALAAHPVNHEDHNSGKHQALPASPLPIPMNSLGAQQPSLAYAGMPGMHVMHAAQPDAAEHSQMHTAMSEGNSIAQPLGGRPSNTQRRRWDDPAEVTSAYPSVPDQNAKAAVQEDQQQGQYARMMSRQRTLPKHPSGGTGPQYYPAFPRTPEEFQDCCDADQTIDGTARLSANLAQKNPTAPLKSWDSTGAWLNNDAYPDKDTFHTPVGPDHGSGTTKAAHDLNQSVVVHMSRAEAWARFAAYEACIQVRIM